MNGDTADTPVPPAERVGQPADVAAALRALNIRTGRPVVVVVGGAAGMTPEYETLVAELAQHLLRAVERRDGALVDGGTDSGIMRVIGQAHDSIGATVPLVGVAAEGTVVLPGKPAPPDAADLDPHHTHVILVPGSAWGDESPWLSLVASAIADGHSSATVVFNGGQVTYDDVEHSLEAARPVIVLAGSGRTADAIAAAAGGAAPNPRAARIAASPDTLIVPLHDLRAFDAALESVLETPLRH